MADDNVFDNVAPPYFLTEFNDITGEDHRDIDVAVEPLLERGLMQVLLIDIATKIAARNGVDDMATMLEIARDSVIHANRRPEDA